MADFVKMKLFYLETQAARKLHTTIYEYINKVTVIGKAWLDNRDGCDISTEEMNELIESTILFLSRKCSELEVDPEVVKALLRRMGKLDNETPTGQTEKDEEISKTHQGSRYQEMHVRENTHVVKNQELTRHDKAGSSHSQCSLEICE